MSLLLLLGGVLPSFGTAAELVDRIIAYVNDDIITLSELNERTNALVAARQQNPFQREQEQSLEEMRQTMLNRLIDERLASQEIARLKITVSEEEIDATIARIMKENRLTKETLEAALRKEERTITDLRQQIKEGLEQRKLVSREVQSKTVITDEIVEAYYQSNMHDFQEKERWRIQDIYLPYYPDDTSEERARIRNLAQEILERVRAGVDFGSLAKNYSQGPGAEAGGDMGYFARGELEPVLEAAVENLKAGEVSPDIETTRGIHIIKVTEVDRSPPKALDEVRESIRNLLYRREVEFRYREWLSSLRERSYVRIVDETGS
ncbi:MAG: peptidylprolyl isomerase [Syntrophobacterales bacterium]|jgi:peptidyl-prolyl cis-trans isomerase SurA